MMFNNAEKHMGSTPAANEIAILRNLTARHRVCWEVWPEYLMLGSQKRQVGFDLELSGTHAPGVEHPMPGCRHCREVFTALLAIAEWILPREKRPTEYEVRPYETKLHYSQSRNNRADVSLAIKLLHRQEAFDPVDACEERCLREIQEKLKELGACKRSWVERNGSTR
jgi:hypothetical protein